MAQPIVSWYEKNDTGEIVAIPETGYKWSLGEVKAGDPSAEKTFYVWNNKGGTEDVSTMQDCKITIVDNASEFTDIIEQKWIRCRLDTVEGDTFDQIGGTTEKEIRAKGQDAGIILGSANSGEIADTDNFTQVTLFALPNADVRDAGIRKFKVRVSYFYV